MRWAAGLSPLLLALWAACGEPSTDPGDPTGPPPRSCSSDDDCEEERENRACRGHRCVNPCGSSMTYVGAGSFLRGCDAKENSGMTVHCAPNAQPVHEVTLTQGFCIGKTEVTVAEYRRCVAAGACPAPPDLACAPLTATWRAQPGDAEQERMPINCLLHSEARAVCAFLDGGRLPTEAEWEKAARGRDERRFPWGNGAPTDCSKGVNWGGGPDCLLELWPAGSGRGSQALSASQALDMAGNLWEWVADWYSESAYMACRGGCTDPAGPDAGVVRVRRGGSYKSLKPQELRASFREFHLPELARSDMIGVRCVRVP